MIAWGERVEREERRPKADPVLQRSGRESRSGKLYGEDKEVRWGKHLRGGGLEHRKGVPGEEEQSCVRCSHGSNRRTENYL